MSDIPQDQPAESLRAIDLLARTVFTWVRQETLGQRFRGNTVCADEQSALAAGFIAGLRTRIALRDSEAEMVAYVYALMSGERNGAAAMSNKLLVQDAGLRFSCSGYLQGLQAARKLLCNFEIERVDSKSDSIIFRSA
jgi:hypothetical protein